MPRPPPWMPRDVSPAGPPAGARRRYGPVVEVRAVVVGMTIDVVGGRVVVGVTVVGAAVVAGAWVVEDAAVVGVVASVAVVAGRTVVAVVVVGAGLATKIVTVALRLRTVPESGSWSDTLSASPPGRGVTCTLRPASVRILLASAVLLPTTSGTVTVPAVLSSPPPRASTRAAMTARASRAKPRMTPARRRR